MSCTKNIGKNMGKNISKNLSGKYTQKLFGHAKQSATDLLKTTPIKVIQKTVKAAGDLIGNKIANKNSITRSFNFLKNNTLFTKKNISLEIHPASSG